MTAIAEAGMVFAPEAHERMHPKAAREPLPPPVLAGEPVHVLAWRLFDYDGRELTYGGLQRWLLSLAELLNAAGHPVVVHQRAHRAFTREFMRGITVVGHRASARAWGSPIFNAKVHRAIPAGAPVVYMVEDLTWPICRERSVVVQHGIWWDGEYGGLKLRMAEHVARHAVRRTGATVCVDTNFVNWFRARWPESGLDERFAFVPNFVDPVQWGPQPEAPAASRLVRDGRLVVCFPRRSEPRRGIWLMADATPILARRFPSLDFRFVVGSGYHTEALRTRLTDAGIDARRWTTEVLPFDGMRAAYVDSAIVTVPTVCGEGTSLSAIEAMYFGCAVVATWVGGLPNVIRDGIDGVLIPPSAPALVDAIARLVEHPTERIAMGRRAMETAREAFGIARWRRGVAPVIGRALALPRLLQRKSDELPRHHD